MLTKEEYDKNERGLYYLSKRFHDYETRYTPIEKARKTIKGSVMSDFCVENPLEGENGKEDFSVEDILDTKLRA